VNLVNSEQKGYDLNDSIQLVETSNNESRKHEKNRFVCSRLIAGL
jgi:hypothetical protein